MSTRSDTAHASEVLEKAAYQPLTAEKVVEHIAEDAEWVLIGEASHGTRDFYELRAEITKVLIAHRGFNAVSCEADFPDASRANLWVQNLSKQDNTPEEALSDFKRFPAWMWRNKEVCSFLQWLHDHNAKVPEAEARQKRVGFYGLDVYSLAASTEAVIQYLEKVDTQAAKTAHKRYSCFDAYGADAVAYAFALARGKTSCERDAVQQLVDVVHKVGKAKREVHGDLGEEEAAFAAMCNARVVKDAEEYYRNMFFADALTWNIRDKHMAETAVQLRQHLENRDIPRPKIVVWAHNSHLGDARETDMGKRRREFNLGQLLREKYGQERVELIGQTTHTGWVAAADNWGEPVKHKRVVASVADSHESVLHDTGLGDFGVALRGASKEVAEASGKERLERAIGVIYRPDTERQSHYFAANLKGQFDQVLHTDETTAVTPLDEGTTGWQDAKEPPDTYPFTV